MHAAMGQLMRTQRGDRSAERSADVRHRVIDPLSVPVVGDPSVGNQSADQSADQSAGQSADVSLPEKLNQEPPEVKGPPVCLAPPGLAPPGLAARGRQTERRQASPRSPRVVERRRILPALKQFPFARNPILCKME
mmetsp:Transcript_66007/g.130897  ORF Transcript_66007/g.130897 Transcript_66007/m.130897 type:complete len:136 (-) Transcript_66007:28-435(-)